MEEIEDASSIGLKLLFAVAAASCALGLAAMWGATVERAMWLGGGGAWFAAFLVDQVNPERNDPDIVDLSGALYAIEEVLEMVVSSLFMLTLVLLLHGGARAGDAQWNWLTDFPECLT
jgi:hypothetical protein